MRALLGSALLLRTLALLVACCQGQAAQSSGTDAESLDIPKLTNETLLINLRAVATSKREVIFTTATASQQLYVDMLRNFVYHLHAVGRDKNLMIISQDEGTCATLLALSIPCYLDAMSPTEGDFPAGHRYAARPFDFGKVWWAYRLAELGYTSLYLDSDVAAVRDPLGPDTMEPGFDLEGLSDFRDAELPTLGAILDHRCLLYREKRDKSIPGGDVFHPSWEIKRNETSLRALAPCQSLGAFYVKPAPAAIKFFAALSDWIMHTHPHQWDQAAWNEVVMAFLVGMGDEAPLRYRILPISRFMNLEVYQKRLAGQLPTQPVLLHAGFLKTKAKKLRFQKLGIWRAEEWEASMGAPGMAARRKACGGSMVLCVEGSERAAGRWIWVSSAILLMGLLAGSGLAAIRWAARQRRQRDTLPNSSKNLSLSLEQL